MGDSLNLCWGIRNSQRSQKVTFATRSQPLFCAFATHGTSSDDDDGDDDDDDELHNLENRTEQNRESSVTHHDS